MQALLQATPVPSAYYTKILYERAFCKHTSKTITIINKKPFKEDQSTDASI